VDDMVRVRGWFVAPWLLALVVIACEYGLAPELIGLISEALAGGAVV